jgi:hypothetical protein
LIRMEFCKSPQEVRFNYSKRGFGKANLPIGQDIHWTRAIGLEELGSE